MKKSIVVALSILGVSVAGLALAASDQKHPREMEWEFDGVFGTLDKQAAQRGYQVYKEVCSACHSMKRVAYRSLTEIGFSEAEVKALAASYQVTDGPNDTGDMFQRPGVASDMFVSPFPNENAAGAGFNGKAPPDLSLMAKARHEGPSYIYSLLTGYADTPADVTLTAGQHYNPYFAGGKILMPPPLSDGQVTYEDGTKATVDQMARDVVTFLEWAAEPEMEARKQTGIKTIFFLIVFTGFMFLAKRNLWRKLH